MSSKRLKKQTAVKYLNGVIERIGEVNRDDSFNYMIARAVVFGSFANNPEYEDFGDLDIGFSMRPKWDGEAQIKRNHAKQLECSSSDWFCYIAWPTEEVLRHIKNRSGYISLHSIEGDSSVLQRKYIELPTDGSLLAEPYYIENSDKNCIEPIRLKNLFPEKYHIRVSIDTEKGFMGMSDSHSAIMSEEIYNVPESVSVMRDKYDTVQVFASGLSDDRSCNRTFVRFFDDPREAIDFSQKYSADEYHGYCVTAVRCVQDDVSGEFEEWTFLAVYRYGELLDVKEARKFLSR
jgi:predicted nucleotidyltransferase